MKTKILFFLLMCVSLNTFAQEEITVQRYTAHNKGKFFISWEVTEIVIQNLMLILEEKITTLRLMI